MDAVPLEILVIGYGNSLRSDDGLGPKIVEQIAALKIPNVRCLERHQLAPELAEDIAGARAVIFVDAAPIQTLSWQSVARKEGAEILTHASDPGVLLALAQTLYGRCPPGWTLRVPAEDFGLGEALSVRGESQVEPAVAAIRKQIDALEKERS